MQASAITSTAKLPSTLSLPTGVNALQVRVAQTFFSRLRGLLCSPQLHNNQALLIRPCREVHTIGMRYAIDVVFINQVGEIIKISPALKPWRAAMCRQAYQTLELAAGQAAHNGLQVGMQL